MYEGRKERVYEGRRRESYGKGDRTEEGIYEGWTI
jgi:hypothetical protein